MKIEKTEYGSARSVDGAVYAVIPEKMELLKFNKTGSFIWTSIKKQMSVDEIAKKVFQKYSVSERKARKDAEVFIRSLVKKKLLSYVDR